MRRPYEASGAGEKVLIEWIRRVELTGEAGAVNRFLCLSEIATCLYEAVRFCSSFRRKPESILFCLCFFISWLIPANFGEMKNRCIVILLENGFRLSPE